MNSLSKKISKVIGINIILIAILLFSPAIFYRLYLKLKPLLYKQLNINRYSRAYYPTFSNKEISLKVFEELGKTQAKYKSFIGWRREKVNFKYTNVAGPYNVRKSKGEAINDSVWFFGGSTMWGSGATDSQTIPSHFFDLTNTSVYNFGESGWTSRQSLNQLINAIGDDYKPSAVIFYDGVNDVIFQCRSEYITLPIHNREFKLKNSVKPFGEIFKSKFLKFITSPYIDLGKKFNIKLLSGNSINSKEYNCDTNKEKASIIAKHLVNNWRTAYALSKSHGFQFYGILQPTLFTTTTNYEYLTSGAVKKNSQFEIQYNIVYDEIIKEIERNCELDKNFCSSMIDGRDWLDGKKNIFWDWCHLNSYGNRVIAQRFESLLKDEN